MLLLNGKELEQTPHLIVSFGGGQGGFSYHYRYVQVDSIENGTIKATGFSIPPSMLNWDAIFVKEDKVIHCFVLTHYPKELRDQVRDHLIKGSITNAKKAFRKWGTKCGPDGPARVEKAILSIPLESIMACNNWFFTGPVMREISQDWVICHEDKCGNQPVIDEKDDMPLSFGTREKAVEYFDNMADTCGLYIVRRTEEIVYHE